MVVPLAFTYRKHLLSWLHSIQSLGGLSTLEVSIPWVFHPIDTNFDNTVK